MASALDLRRVTAGYGETVVLEDVSLAIEAGECISVIGRNGVGKTTLLATVMGHTTLHRGVVRLGSADLARVPAFRRARLGIGYVPQEREIFPSLSVRENLDVAARPGHWTPARVFELFPNLEGRLGNKGNQLSGGEQQMLAIGRALMTNPHLLILDEATEGLAPLIREEIWNCLSMLKTRGQSILVIDKNVEHLTRICDRHYIIERGRTVWCGMSEQLIAEPGLQHRYLGI